MKGNIAPSDIRAKGERLGEVVTFLKNWKITLKTFDLAISFISIISLFLMLAYFFEPPPNIYYKNWWWFKNGLTRAEKFDTK